jgi:hypothetical protein
MTATQAIKICQILRTHFDNDADAIAVLEEIRIIIESKDGDIGLVAKDYKNQPEIHLKKPISK